MGNKLKEYPFNTTKGIATITPEEVQQVINKHIFIKIQQGFDYKLFFILFPIFSVVIIIGLIWNFQLRTLNKKLDNRQAELTELSEKLFQQQEKYRLLANSCYRVEIHLGVWQ